MNFTQRVTAEEITHGQERAYGPDVSTYVVTFERAVDEGFGVIAWVVNTFNAERQPHAALAFLGYDNLYENCRDETDRHFKGTVTARHLGPGRVEVVRSTPWND